MPSLKTVAVTALIAYAVVLLVEFVPVLRMRKVG